MIANPQQTITFARSPIGSVTVKRIVFCGPRESSELSISLCHSHVQMTVLGLSWHRPFGPCQKDKPEKCNLASPRDSEVCIPRLNAAIPSILGLLGGLGPELHHEEHEPIDTDYKHNDNARIPPSVVLFSQVQRAEVISTGGVLANAAAESIIWVQKVRAHPYAMLVDVEIFTTGLVGSRVKNSQLVWLAMHGSVPSDEYQHRTKKVIEGVQVVHPKVKRVLASAQLNHRGTCMIGLPVPPEGDDLAIGNHDATERDESGDHQRVD